MIIWLLPLILRLPLQSIRQQVNFNSASFVFFMIILIARNKTKPSRFSLLDYQSTYKLQVDHQRLGDHHFFGSHLCHTSIWKYFWIIKDLEIIKVHTFIWNDLNSGSSEHPISWNFYHRPLPTWNHFWIIKLFLSSSPTDMYLDVFSRSKWVGEPD